MKSSTGQHYIALDHVRALAAFMVFFWHFSHQSLTWPLARDYVPSIFPFALLVQGHTGVALFMTLSGYLFAKLLDGKTIDYRAFIWNRMLRLLPMLAVASAIYGYLIWAQGFNMRTYVYSILRGILQPTLPVGGWSVATEFHFYLILPMLLWLFRRSNGWALAVLGAAIAYRWLMKREDGEVQMAAYFTILGRIDQFVLGIVAYQFRSRIARRHVAAGAVAVGFAYFYYLFTRDGGFYLNPTFPSGRMLWIYMPTIEGLAYAFLISYYDNTFTPSRTGISRVIGIAGEYSYSIYLLHGMIIAHMHVFIQAHFMHISTFYETLFWAVICYSLMIPVGFLSYHLVEKPFLKLRRPYLLGPSDSAKAVGPVEVDGTAKTKVAA